MIPRTHIKPGAGAVVCNLSAPITIEEVELRDFWEAHGPASLAYDGTKKVEVTDWHQRLSYECSYKHACKYTHVSYTC